MDLRPKIELRLEPNLLNQASLEQLPPEYKTAELRAALDLMARLAEYDIMTLGAEQKELAKEMLKSRITFNDTRNCYYMPKNVLLNQFNYNHMQYIAAGADSNVAIKFSRQFQKNDLESLVEGNIKLRKTAKRTYITAEDGTKLAEARGAVLKLLAKPGSAHYSLALDAIVDIATKIHSENLLMAVPTISMNNYLLGFFLNIPEYLNLQSYVKDTLKNFAMCLEKKVQAVAVDEKNVPAKVFCRATEKNKNCFVVDKKFVKRHVKYFFADENKKITVVFGPELDRERIIRSIMNPIQVSIDNSAWVNLEELDYTQVELRKSQGRVRIKTLGGAKLLRNTGYASSELKYARGSSEDAIKRKDSDAPLVLLRKQSVTVPYDLCADDREMAFDIVNALYAQLLFQTPFVERNKKKSALRSDEREIIKEINRKAMRYIEGVGGTYADYANSLVQRDMLKDTMKALKEIPNEISPEKIPLLEAVKKYKTSLVDALRATKQGIIKTDETGNVYIQDFEKFMEDKK